MFQRKKIQSETLSEYLVEVRESLGLSLDSVSSQTGIQKKFLDMLEHGRVHQLPPEVYTHGFLKQLSRLYKISEKEIIAQYNKERGIVTKVLVEGKNQQDSKFRFNITPKVLSLAVVVLFVCASLVYVAFQLHSVNMDPKISIFEPKAGGLINTSFVHVKGKTEAGSQLSINGAAVFVSEDGSFQATVSVGAGQTELVLVSQNKFGKKAHASVSVVRQANNVAASETEAISPLSLSVKAEGHITIALTVDGTSQPQVELEAGEVQTTNAQKKILLSTTDAGRTKVAINGKELGVLGKPGEELIDIPFGLESASQLLGSLDGPTNF